MRFIDTELDSACVVDLALNKDKRGFFALTFDVFALTFDAMLFLCGSE